MEIIGNKVNSTQKIYIIKALTKNGKGGNLAGVMLNSEHIEKEIMQEIAKKVDLSETAFVSKSKTVDYKVIFYTRNGEIDMCGHATIATYKLLLDKKMIEIGEYIQEIKAGCLKITINPDGLILMDQRKPEYKQEIKIDEIAEILKIPSEWIKNTNLNPRIVSTGVIDLIIPIDNRQHLNAINEMNPEILALQKKYNLDSLHIFTFDTLYKNSKANTRNFDPLHGIIEESATGTSNGALACYLFKNDLLTKEEIEDRIIIEQGYNMNSPSEIYIKLDIKGNEIERVRVGGYAHMTNEMTLNEI